MDKCNLSTPKKQAFTLLEYFDDLKVTNEMMSEIEETQFCYANLIVEGHMTVICSQANGGKTTIFTHVSGEMIKSNYQVIYINADASAVDLKGYQFHAQKNGYTLIAPDLKNEPTEKIIKMLEAKSVSNETFHKVVLVIDTLKKFTNVIQKSEAKKLYKTLRTLTVKGMTVICLAHTNKYNADDGTPIYEGTSDLRSDFDELIYLVADKDSEGTLTVQTKADKVRAPIKDMTFRIDKSRNVQVIQESIDLIEKKKIKIQLEKDSQIIKLISKEIEKNPKSLTQIHQKSIQDSIKYTRKKIEKVLHRYCIGNCENPLWKSSPAPTNGLIYQPINNGGEISKF